jgi:hypothetical protein
LKPVSHYRVLGVPLGATRVAIRAAYLRAARSAHPDLLGDHDGPARQRAADRMCAVNEAWRVLGDPARRRVYDAHRIATAAGATRRATSGPTTTAGGAGEPRPERVPGRAPAGGRATPLVLVPAALFGLALLQLLVGLVVGIPTMLATGAVTVALSVAAFAAAPLLMLAATRNTRRPAPG